ncbi:serine/threonine-protein phosphatase 7 long form homolog [Lycium barbarum]|uniref:serine/threonine-protein phosphatase 7 long form homolog n=1 Tax=Lycium barbarum TaxID=112863 RepID=UPI00293F0B2C|nr:serine/threonine-protein phosphatase 7 long form homolog [Lycium barbarum]
MDPAPLHSGLFEPDVFYLQQQHRSQLVGDSDVDPTCLVRRRFMEQALDILVARPPHPRVLEILYQGGIYRCIAVGRVQHDKALVMAMIERWRLETHTFHLRTDEATITLQDVEVLYGLQVDGRALYIAKPQQMPSYR